MIPESLIDYFMPTRLQSKLHPDHERLRMIIIGALVVSMMLTIISLPMLFFTGLTLEYYIVALTVALCLVALFSIKYAAHYKVPVILMVGCAYFNNIHGTINTGGIFSPNISLFYVPLLVIFWVLGSRAGLWVMLGNILSLIFVYKYIPVFHAGSAEAMPFSKRGIYALALNIAINLFLGAFLYMVSSMYNKARQLVRHQQLMRIRILDQEVADRTQQLSTMRQNLARDFHDETGNMLSAITRQAGVLKLRLEGNQEVLSLVDNILLNSKKLYDSSKDFLWSINHDSDDPREVFSYLTSFGQFFYNQFDIAFSVRFDEDLALRVPALPMFSGRHLIFIFKEAMTNAARHSAAGEVELAMTIEEGSIRFVLADNGTWKKPAQEIQHHGLQNMQKRCLANNFSLSVQKDDNGTCIAVRVPVVQPVSIN